ncbi:type II toxin-antitoxin system PemK/MazF family toxin [Nocardia wallacei]|uniref:type II toxin-antitoxin system PemK/MazF family toxin n=1 Tax=Nocardia wallacei TaxID=480035 RepID=UPI0024557180|nr:type II toxin-antitoxin system PemK/MazF family toxin [Nocardia wallacei]
MIRGLIHRIDLGEAKRGHEQRGRRYGVVLSRTDWTMVTVVPTSTGAAPSLFRPEVEIDGRPTRLLVDQIRSINVDFLKGEPVGYLSQRDMARLDATIIRYLGLE